MHNCCKGTPYTSPHNIYWSPTRLEDDRSPYGPKHALSSWCCYMHCYFLECCYTSLSKKRCTPIFCRGVKFCKHYLLHFCKRPFVNLHFNESHSATFNYCKCLGPLWCEACQRTKGRRLPKLHEEEGWSARATGQKHHSHDGRYSYSAVHSVESRISDWSSFELYWWRKNRTHVHNSISPIGTQECSSHSSCAETRSCTPASSTKAYNFTIVRGRYLSSHSNQWQQWHQ